MAESKDDVADQLIAMGYSEEDVSTSQSKALNPSNINEVHDLVRAELKEDEEEQEYYRRIIKEYKKERGPLPPQRAPSFVRNWAMKHEEFANNVPRHSLLKALLETDTLNVNDSLPITDLSLNPKFSSPAPDASDQGSQGPSSLSSPSKRMPINPNDVTDDLLIENIRDVLDEVNYEVTDRAKKFLYFRMGATGSKAKLLRDRIDNIVSEIHRQRVECFVSSVYHRHWSIASVHKLFQGTLISSGPPYVNKSKQRQSVRIKNLEILDDDDNPEMNELTPTAYIENVSRLQKTEEHQRIRADFRTKMQELLGERTRQDLYEETALFECSFDTCPCVERIDLMMKTYAELTNSEDLWRRVPIAPLMTFDDRYLHQQLHDDFIHIKLYHIDRRFQTNHMSADAKKLNIPEDELIEQKEIEGPVPERDIARELYNKFSNQYPCPDMSSCKGFARHYRERGADAQEHRWFHVNNDQSISARTRRTLNEKEGTLQEECDKIHSYFLHSLIQFSGSTEVEAFDSEAKRAIDNINGAAAGRSFSRNRKNTGDRKNGRRLNRRNMNMDDAAEQEALESLFGLNQKTGENEDEIVPSAQSKVSNPADMTESKEHVADQLIQSSNDMNTCEDTPNDMKPTVTQRESVRRQLMKFYSEENVSSAQRRASNPADINEVHDICSAQVVHVQLRLFSASDVFSKTCKFVVVTKEDEMDRNTLMGRQDDEQKKQLEVYKEAFLSVTNDVLTEKEPLIKDKAIQKLTDLLNDDDGSLCKDFPKFFAANGSFKQFMHMLRGATGMKPTTATAIFTSLRAQLQDKMPKEDQKESNEENDHDYAIRVIESYEKENGKLDRGGQSANYVRTWASTNEQFRNRIPRHSQLKSLLEMDSLPVTDLSLSAKFSNSFNDASHDGSQGGSVPIIPLKGMPINPNAVTDDPFIEGIRDVLDEVNYEVTDRAKKFLYSKMGATRPKAKLLRNRIDNIVAEIQRQRVECIFCNLYAKMCSGFDMRLMYIHYVQGVSVFFSSLLQNTKEDDSKNVYLGKKEDEDWIENIRRAKGDDAYKKLVERMGVFRWQTSHGFHTGQERGLSQLKPKYTNIREEALQNSFSRVSKTNWNWTLRKAKIIRQSFAGKRIKTLHRGSHQDQITGVEQEWERGTQITLEEIVTLKLYTDEDRCQYELKKCLRWETMSTVINRQDIEKNLEKKEQQQREELKQRLQEFFHWKAALQIVLNKFGKKFRHQSARLHLYHGVNAKMILNPVETMAFHGPLSTSTSKYVAETFATAKGMVLEITTQYPRLDFCCAFDASVLSDYPEEQEYLIGFVYLRVLDVFTRPLVNDVLKDKEWREQPVASQIRNAFFAIHLFREQMFSMSEHLEYYLVEFLKCLMKHCCLSSLKKRLKLKQEGHEVITNQQRTKDKYKYSFLSWLCANIAGHKNAKTKPDEWNDEKNRFRNEEWKTVMSILWGKFNEYRRTPNLKQVIKIDQISEKLKHFLLEEVRDKNGNPELDVYDKPRHNVDFEKILKIFPNCREIHYFNQYKFDGQALQKLVETLLMAKHNNLRRLRFLYYDFTAEEKDEKTGLMIPRTGDKFFNPARFETDKDLKRNMDQLKSLGWKFQTNICKNEKGSYGYRITISNEKGLGYEEFLQNNQ